jgi:WD40 repeat protein
MRTIWIRAIIGIAALLCGGLASAQRPNIRWYGAGTQSTYIACSHNGDFIATAGVFEYSVKIWRTSDNSLVRTIAVGDREMESIALTPDDQYLLVGLDGIFGDDRPTLRLYRISDGAYIRGYNPNNNAQNEFGVDVSPDGTMVAGAQQSDGTDIYNLSTGALVRHIPGANWGVKFSPDSQSILANTPDGACLFSVATGALIRKLAPGGNLFSFSQDGQYVAIAAEQEFLAPIWIVRVSDGQTVRTLSGGTVQYVFGIRLSANGSKLVAVGIHDAVVWLPFNVSDCAVDCWDIASGTVDWDYRYEYGAGFGVDISPDGQYAYMSGGKETYIYPAFDPHGRDSILRFRMSDGQQIGITTGRMYVTSIAFTPDSSVMAVGGLLNVAETVRVSDGAHLNYFVGHAAAIRGLAFSPDGQTLATGGGDSDPYFGPDGTIKLWRVSDSTLLRSWVADGSGVAQLHFTPDGATILECGGSGDIRFFRVSDGAYLGRILQSGTIDLSPDGTLIAVGTSSSQIKIYRVSDRALVRTISDIWAVDSVAFSPDGTMVAATYEATPDPNLKLYRVSDGALIRTFPGYPSSFALIVKFSPDGQTLVLNNIGGVMQFWRVSDGALLQQYDEELGHGAFAIGTMAISPDGRSIGVGRWDSMFELIAFPGLAQTVNPTSVQTFRGSLQSCVLANLFLSDDLAMSWRPGAVLSATESPIDVILTGTSPSVSPSVLQFKLEARASGPNLGQKVQLFNYATNAWEQVNFRTATTSDSVATITVSAPASRFVNPSDGQMKARVSYKATGPILSYPWQVRIDQAVWTVTP